MKALNIDIECYSSYNLAEVGVYKYCEAPDFTILLFGYSVDDEETVVIDMAQGEELPEDIFKALTDSSVKKTAFNANFERTAIGAYFNTYMEPEQWDCTMIMSLRLGLPGSLDMVGKVLKFPEDKQKLKIGKKLIKQFCIPSKINNSHQITFIDNTRVYPKDAPKEWELFKEYNKQDVEVEKLIRKRLKKYEETFTEKDYKLWCLDQRINDLGVRIDDDMAEAAICVNNEFVEEKTREAKELTGLNNPNSASQLKKWIQEKTNTIIPSLNKDAVPNIIKNTDDEDVKKMLNIRSMLAKTSVKKYETMIACQCKDKRAHGLLQFYGANRTGRWAGRLVQVQNLPQNHLEDLDDARIIVKTRDAEIVEMIYDNVPDTLSQLIRTAFIPAEGNKFVVADFSAIEARVIAWIAGEQWRMDVFRENGDIYCASASQMFKVPVKKHGINGHLRQKGKIAELALGYGGAAGALEAMDRTKSLKPEEFPSIVKSWRESSPNIVKFWWDVDKAAKRCILKKTRVNLQFGLSFYYLKGIMFIKLPSGRSIAYVQPKLEQDYEHGSVKITYMGMEQTTKTWERMETYGPKLVENIVQAIARDCLGEVLLRIADAGYKIVMHVHDEAIIDAPIDLDVKDINKIFGIPIEWAPGLLLKADGYECMYYQKD